ncbi:wax ester synthase/diacylglycerol acyltransferase 11-like isoform X2 [Macadamia integrifolia]|uniref:wax ester synthase/diacylglycerol acyltransferase 11-like isoform X2 n=1 Tax=Macadamia integrifolia TaxID=60698 RepID=UPI001C4E3BAD|nr:wax ester synthase/diacylglycerol acyltransferase 11-like isoform X2 [Macadamia integrifolia]
MEREVAAHREDDEPLTPAGRFFLQPEMNQVINCAIGMKNPIDIEALKDAIKDSLMLQHPRFRSVLVRDKQGREHWRQTQLDLDNHVFLREIGSEENDDDETVVNDYLADLAVSSPMSTDKPLWELNVVRARKCCVLRIHHALGDGISLMSLFIACCRKADRPDQMATIPNNSSSSSILRREGEKIGIGGRLRWIWRMWLRLMMAAWFTLVYAMEFLLRCLWVKDEKTAISGGDGVELWPRKIATAKFSIDDMKAVKRALVNATINDVLFGVISSGLSRYLDLKTSKKPREGIQISGLSMVNIRKQPGLQEMSKLVKSKSGSRWGNQFGFMILPVYYHREVNDPLQYVKRAKAMIDKKKLSLEAHFSYKIAALVMSLLGPKVAIYLNHRIVCNTTFTISNVLGPQEEIMIAGNPINYIRVNTAALTHAITMHMVSYAGRAEMQILVAKDIIPDPKVLAKCFEDALLEMKDAAATSTAVQEGKDS